MCQNSRWVVPSRARRARPAAPGFFLAVLAACAAAATRADEVAPPPAELKQALRLADFYQKCLVADGLPILASAKVSDYALYESRHLVDQMLAGRNDVRQAIVRAKIRLVVMAADEFTTDVPEHSDLKPARYWNRRARGLGATPIRPADSCGEEKLLEFEGDPYHAENILIHEFGHVIHETGMAGVDETFDGRLDQAYRQALERGLWKGTYAASNRSEYWAEGVQSWFHCNRVNDNQHNHVNSREELKEYDPALAALLAEVFPRNDWIYTRPRQRRDAAHLRGYDRSLAPKFAWPNDLINALEEARPER